MENLETLYITHVMMTCFKPINKLNWPNLKNLSLHYNHANKVEINRTRTAVYFDQLQLNGIADTIQIQDISILAKF